MIDREQDEYRGDLQQILFPMFIVLHLQMITQQFEDGAKRFWEEFAELFEQPEQGHPQTDLQLLKEVRNISDLRSNLDYERFFKNKFVIKMSFHAREVLDQFLKFENMSLLMYLINQYFDFHITRQRNIIDLLQAEQALAKGKLSTDTHLVPKHKSTTQQEKERLTLGRLPVFTRDVKKDAGSAAADKFKRKN